LQNFEIQPAVAAILAAVAALFLEARMAHSFADVKLNDTDRNRIDEVVDRATTLFAKMDPPLDRLCLTMDLMVVHAVIFPLDLEGMVTGDETNFAHDIGGISRYLDRTNGRLMDSFEPHFALAA
jgi:hypothetical protein